MTSPTIEVERITPTKAKQYLEANDGNRNMRESAVDRYARDMRAGNWRMTGEPIQFSRDGTLLNGQHRLAAIVKSKKPIKMVVMHGVDDNTVAFMDTGQKRTFADVLKLAGYANVTILAAAIRFGIRYENGWLKSQNTPTHGEMLAWLNDNHGLTQSVSAISATSMRTKKYFPTTPASYIHYLTKDSMPGEFDTFMALVMGETIDNDLAKQGSPAHVYRRYMESHFLMRARKVHPLMLQAIMVKAFNAYILGVENVNHFRWRIGGSAAEEFPTIISQYPS